MTHFDDAIRNALSPDDARAYDALGRNLDPLRAALGTLVREPRLVAIGAGLLGLGLLAAAAFAAFQFAEADTTRGMVGWAAGALLALFALGFLKLWFFLEMQKDAFLRALKRIELQLSVALPTAQAGRR
jgi:hypothetical protein